MTHEQLIQIAIEAMKKSYSPYSEFTVGAAILTKSGKVYMGANIENASYGATICAERTAVGMALMDGEKEFDKIAIVASSKDYVPPCGICRQVLSEFCDEKTEILCGNKMGEFVVIPFKDIFPYQFCHNQLTKI